MTLPTNWRELLPKTREELMALPEIAEGKFGLRDVESNDSVYWFMADDGYWAPVFDGERWCKRRERGWP
jgi:hypothetical protein